MCVEGGVSDRGCRDEKNVMFCCGGLELRLRLEKMPEVQLHLNQWNECAEKIMVR